LLLNDFHGKATYHNWLTGKLSDIAGIFIFLVFLTALFPNYKKVWVLSTAVLFIIWKSPLAEPAIQLFNHIGISISRTIDYTDLIALLVLQLTYHYDNLPLKKIRISPVVVGIIAILQTW